MMNEFYIKFETIGDVCSFVNKCILYDEFIEVRNDYIIADGKVLMELVRLVGKSNLTAEIVTDDINIIKQFKSNIKDYMC